MVLLRPVPKAPFAHLVNSSAAFDWLAVAEGRAAGVGRVVAFAVLLTVLVAA
jgi:hypothetical protein